MKKNIYKKIASFTLAAALTISEFAVPAHAIQAAVDETAAREEALRLELAGYTDRYPQGAFAFYETEASMKEGDADKEIWLVRLGNSEQEAAIDLKCMDMTAKYGEDYEIYLKEGLKKTKLEADGTVNTLMEQAIAERTVTESETAEVTEDAIDSATELEMGEDTANLQVADVVDVAGALIGNTVTDEAVTVSDEEKDDEIDTQSESADTQEDVQHMEEAAGGAADSHADAIYQTAQDESIPSLRKSYAAQTGEQVDNDTWRDRQSETAAQAASIEAENQLINELDGPSMTINFAPGEYKKKVYIHVVDNDIAESEENAALLLGNASVGMLGENSRFQITIADNEEEDVVFEMKDSEITAMIEDGYAEFTITRVSGLGYYAGAIYQTRSNTAEANVAYEPQDQSVLSFAPQETEKKVRIPLLEDAMPGTSFTVELGGNASEGKESVTVQLQSSEYPTMTSYAAYKAQDVLADVRAGKITSRVNIGGVMYSMTKLNLDPSRSTAYIHTKSDLDCSANCYDSFSYYGGNVTRDMLYATMMDFNTTLYGESNNWLLYYYAKNGCLDLANGPDSYSSYKFRHSMSNDEGKKQSPKGTIHYTDYYIPITYQESKAAGFHLNTNEDSLCRDAGYRLNWVQYYIPDYTIKLLSADAKQTLTGHLYTSKNDSTTFKVDALKGNASWSQVTLKYENVQSSSKCLSEPGTLNDGVSFDGYEIYLDGVSGKVGTCKAGASYSQMYDVLNKLRDKYDAYLKNTNYTVKVKPVYKTASVSVLFKADNKSMISFSGDKSGQKGFKADSTLHCKSIDKISVTATCPSDQELKVDSVTETIKSSGKMTKHTPGENDPYTCTFTTDTLKDKTIMAYYKEPQVVIRYRPGEESAANADVGAILISNAADPTGEVIGTSNYKTPCTLKSLSASDPGKLFGTKYIAQVVLGEGKDVFEENGIKYRTNTYWTYRQKGDSRTNTYTSKTNSLYIDPYYGDTEIQYKFRAEQEDVNKVGVKGTVKIAETPLFGLNNKVNETNAVAVKLNIGGYNATTNNLGQYEIEPNYNVGDYVASYLQFDTLTLATNVNISSEGSTRDFLLNVNEDDNLKVTNSYITKDVLAGEPGHRYQGAEKDVVNITLEDANYYLNLNVQGDSGHVPNHAVIKFYDKDGREKPDLEQTTKLTDVNAASSGTMRFAMNPMAMPTKNNKQTSLEVGDCITVKLYDKNGVGYFERHTAITIAEKLEGMYMFNYQGVESAVSNAFIKALGGISTKLMASLDVVGNETGTFRNADNELIDVFSVGVGDTFFQGVGQTDEAFAQQIYGYEQLAIKSIEQGYSSALGFVNEDDFSVAEDGAFDIRLQVGMIMDCKLIQKGANSGKYKFNNFVILGSVVASYSNDWKINVGPLALKFGLKFSTGNTKDMMNGATGLKWYFYPKDDKEYILSENSTLDLLINGDMENTGSFDIVTDISGNVKLSLAGLIGVGGGIFVGVNAQFAHNTDASKQSKTGWINKCTVNFKPSVSLTVLGLDIPIWKDQYTLNYQPDVYPDNSANARAQVQSIGAQMEEAYQEADMLHAPTSAKEWRDYSYMDQRSAWQGSAPADKMPTVQAMSTRKADSVEDLKAALLQDHFYDNSKVTMKNLGNGKYLAAFLDNVEGRSNENRIGAYYSVYDGNEWSKPELLDDDGTPDELPVICEAGSKGYLVVWSDACETLKDEIDVSTNLNKYNLSGCFYQADTNTMGAAMDITKRTNEDQAADTNPHLSYYHDGANEYMKIYYTKSQYYVSDQTEGEVAGDLLYPEEQIAVRTYDFANDKWQDTYSEKTAEQIKNNIGADQFAEYESNWYGQEFLSLGPCVITPGEFDEDGFWVDGWQPDPSIITVADDASITAGDVMTYNGYAAFAYSVGENGSVEPSGSQNQNLYLQLYNYAEDKYEYPIRLTAANNVSISDIQFATYMTPANEEGTQMEERVYLYWLEDGRVKRLNISNIIQHCLKETTGKDGTTKIYYVDKSRPADGADGYEPEDTVVEFITGTDETKSSISNFKIENTGVYNYIVYSSDQCRDPEDNKKIESQLYAVRENTRNGDSTLPVQITDMENYYIGDFDVAIAEDGKLDILGARKQLGEDGEMLADTSELVYCQLTPSDKIEIEEEQLENPVFAEDGSVLVDISADIKNNSLNKAHDLSVEITDKDGKLVYDSAAKQKKYTSSADADSENIEIIVEEVDAPEFVLRGGESSKIMAQVPLSDTYTLTVKNRNDGVVLTTKQFSGKPKMQLATPILTAKMEERGKVQLSSELENNTVFETGDFSVDFGYVNANGDKVKLGSQNMASLAPSQTSEVSYEVQVDMNQFVTTVAEDGSVTDSLEFYMDINEGNVYTSYNTVSVSADAYLMERINAIKEVGAKAAIINADAKAEEVTLAPGDEAQLELVINGDFAQNSKEFKGDFKAVWTETSNESVIVSEDGYIEAVGAGTTSVSGYLMPTDMTSVLYGDGSSDQVDNYNLLPSKAIIPITAEITVEKTSTETEPPQSSEEPGQSTPPAGSEEPGQSTPPAGSEEPGQSTPPAGSEEPGQSMLPAGSEEPGQSTSPNNLNSGNKTDIISSNQSNTTKAAVNSSVSAKTGDNSNVALWVTLLCISGAAAVGSMYKRRKRKNHT
ncbi:MAG: hypothetical protein HFI75_05420 [Lachnospiraceae bacterium]|nr:hypothetical protein [Lachnospiraceae bacterium]